MPRVSVILETSTALQEPSDGEVATSRVAAAIARLLQEQTYPREQIEIVVAWTRRMMTSCGSSASAFRA